MTSLQRVAAAVRFEATDRPPVIAQVFGHAATLAGVPLVEYVRHGETLACCQLDARNRYGYDAVFAVMDANVEAEGAGAVLRYRDNQYPSIERHALARADDCDQLSLPDAHGAGRMPEMLKALSILRGELGDEALVVGCVLGPFTLTAQLLGLEAALYLAADDPQRLDHLMDFATEIIISFGRAQLQSGAHLPMVFDPCASPAVIPPAFFRELELPRLRRVFQALAEAGALANWLHIAGPVAPILRYYADAGVQIANFDYSVSAADAASALPRTCLDGNIKSLAFVEEGPDRIAEQAASLLRAFRERGGFVLSSGCEIPPESNPDNVVAMVHAGCAVGNVVNHA